MNNGHDPLGGGGAAPQSRPSTPDEVRRGKTDMIIAAHEGQVIVRFPQAMNFLVMDPENARNIGESIARASFEARYGEKPPTAASEIARQARDKFTETTRLKLIARIALVLNSENIMAMAPKDRALRVVDIIMTELV
jgi:hypothetical protein